MVAFMIGNVGFGPLAAYLLRLPDLFSFTPGLELNAEIMAGMFEIILGALERRGEQGLLVAVTYWALLLIFVIAVPQWREATHSHDLTASSVKV